MNVILIYEMGCKTLLLVLVVILLLCLLLSSLYWLWINHHEKIQRKQGGVYPKNSIMSLKNIFGEEIETSKVIIFDDEYYLYGTQLKQQIVKNYNVIFEHENNRVSNIMDNFKNDLIPYVCDNSEVTILNNQLKFKINDPSTLSKLYYCYYIYYGHIEDLDETIYDNFKNINLSEIFGLETNFVSPYLYIPDNHSSFKYNLIERMYDKYTQKLFPYVGNFKTITTEILWDACSFDNKLSIKYRIIQTDESLDKSLDNPFINIFESDIQTILLLGYRDINKIEDVSNMNDDLLTNLSTIYKINEEFLKYVISDVEKLKNHFGDQIREFGDVSNELLYAIIFITNCDGKYINNSEINEIIINHRLYQKNKIDHPENDISFKQFELICSHIMNGLMDLTHISISTQILCTTEYNNVMFLTERYYGRTFSSKNINTEYHYDEENNTKLALLSPSLKNKNIDQQLRISTPNAEHKMISFYDIDERYSGSINNMYKISNPLCDYLNVAPSYNIIMNLDKINYNDYDGLIKIIDNKYKKYYVTRSITQSNAHALAEVSPYTKHNYKINNFSILCILSELLTGRLNTKSDNIDENRNYGRLYAIYKKFVSQYHFNRNKEDTFSYLYHESVMENYKEIFEKPINTFICTIDNYMSFINKLIHLFVTLTYYLADNENKSNELYQIILNFRIVVLNLLLFYNNPSKFDKYFTKKIPKNKYKNIENIAMNPYDNLNEIVKIFGSYNYKYYFVLSFVMMAKLLCDYYTKTENLDEGLNGFKWYIYVVLFNYYNDRTMYLTDEIDKYVDKIYYYMIDDLKERSERIKRTETEQNYVLDNLPINDSVWDLLTTVCASKMDIIATYKILKYPLMKYEITNEKYKNRIDTNLDPLGKTFYIFYGGSYHGILYSQLLDEIYYDPFEGLDEEYYDDYYEEDNE